MRVSTIIPPDPFVTYEEAKAQLRLDDDSEQDLVEALIAAASQWIDGPEGWLGCSIGRQTLEARLTEVGEILALPYGPVTGIVDVRYLDGAGVEQTLSPTAYTSLLDGSVQFTTRPSAKCTHEAIRVQYEAGYDNVPAPIKQAVLMLLAHWFKNRETVVTGTIATSLPFAVEALLSPYRRWPL